MSTPTIQVQFLKILKASRCFGVSPESIRGLIRDGKPKGYRPLKGTAVFVSVLELEAHFAGSVQPEVKEYR